MKKKLTPKQKMKEDTNYSLEDFFSDLFREVKLSISKDDFRSTEGETKDIEHKKTVHEVYRFVSEICFKAAINSPDLKLLLEKSKSEEKEIIRETLKSNKDNIEVLRALLMRQVSTRLERGITKRQAAKQVITQGKGILIEFLGKSASDLTT
jgi:hypothetical protein